jgi:DMSO/TMAO reductase YedYZ heme-binding membrane subunit
MWWYAARAGGIVSWSLLAASFGWGLGMASHLFKGRGRPARMLDIHGYLGTLACVFVVVHVVGILADGWIQFGVADVLIPFHAPWHPLATAAGVVALWLLAAVEVTSLLRDRLPNVVWRRVHYASYGLFALGTVHGLTTGSDTKGAVIALVALVVAALSGATAVRVMARQAEEEARLADRAARQAERVAVPVTTPETAWAAEPTSGPSPFARPRAPS